MRITVTNGLTREQVVDDLTVGLADDQRGPLINRTKGNMNTKVHTVTYADDRPIRFFVTAGQVSDNTGAATPLGSLPKAEWRWPTGTMMPTGSVKL